MDVAEVAHEPETPLMRWTAEEFIELLDTGVVESRRVELLDGLVINEMPQGELHDFIYTALHLVFVAMGAYEQGLAPMKTIVLGTGSVVEPEFVLLYPEAVGRFGLAKEADARWVIEVSVTSRRKDLTTKKDAYARANIAHYWVFDATRRGTWIFSEPRDGDYAAEAFVPAGELVTLPILGATLDTGAVFPPAEA